MSAWAQAQGASVVAWSCLPVTLFSIGNRMTHRPVRLEKHEFFVRGVREPVRRHLIGERWVDVWIPDAAPSGIIIAHDGQNIFDDRAAMHHQTWDAARSAIRAARHVGVNPPAVVGVWNGSTAERPLQRGFELAPQKVMSAAMTIDPRVAGWFDASKMEGDKYLAELCDQIVPTVTALVGSKAPIAMMGSSMGALATIYALGERPDVFTCGLTFSVHWPFAGDPLVDGLIDRLPAPGRIRLWMQNGTGGLDSPYAPFQQRADARLAARGYRPGRDFVSRVLRRSGHNEWSWAKRLPDAISWWLRGL
jgi:predicted alpha/beta superfamily hydrolase